MPSTRSPTRSPRRAASACTFGRPVIPRSLPYFFGSLKVAITLAFVGAVVSETVGSNKGIGKLMLDAQAAFQVPIVFAGLLVLAVMGIVLYAATAAIETRFTGWAFRGQASR